MDDGPPARPIRTLELPRDATLTRSRPPTGGWPSSYHPNSAGIVGTGSFLAVQAGRGRPDRGTRQAAFSARWATAPGEPECSRSVGVPPGRQRDPAPLEARAARRVRRGAPGPGLVRVSEPVQRAPRQAPRPRAPRPQVRHDAAVGRPRGSRGGWSSARVARPGLVRAPDASRPGFPHLIRWRRVRAPSSRSGRARAGMAAPPRHALDDRSSRVRAPPEGTARTASPGPRRTDAGRRSRRGRAPETAESRERGREPPPSTPRQRRVPAPAGVEPGPGADDGWTVPPYPDSGARVAWGVPVARTSRPLGLSPRPGSRSPESQNLRGDGRACGPRPAASVHKESSRSVAWRSWPGRLLRRTGRPPA